MHNCAFERILAISASPNELSASVDYLTNCMKPILKFGEKVLICFSREAETDFGNFAEKAVRKCGALPFFWETDLRWIELLRLAFVTRATTIIAPPLILLGLSKIAAYKTVPLFLHNAILAGYPCMDWMMDGIEKGLDCRIWGVFGPGDKSVVGGFSCNSGRGIHIREDKFDIEIIDSHGNKLPDGQHGRILVCHKDASDIRFATSSFGSFLTQPCPCGNPAPKLVGIDMGEQGPSSILRLAEELLHWNSILDCNMVRAEMGLEVEIVCFQGEKMPKLPSCAKLLVRPWNPENDVPFSLTAKWILP